jgi:hypothetical protein
MEKIEWEGNIYHRSPQSKKHGNRSYFRRVKQKNKKRKTWLLHREVWKKYKGEIPAGMIVHHIDGDFANNDISNLSLMTRSDHVSNHNLKRWSDPIAVEKQRQKLKKLSTDFLKTEKGMDHLKRIAKLSMKNFIPEEMLCWNCGKKFMSRTNRHDDLFCSAECQRDPWHKGNG